MTYMTLPNEDDVLNKISRRFNDSDVVSIIPAIMPLAYKNHDNKCKFLYSAVSSPWDCLKRFILYFPGRPVPSDTITTSPGSI